MFYNILPTTIKNINAMKIPKMKHINNILDIIFRNCFFSCPFLGVSEEDVTTPLGIFHRGGYRTHAHIASSLNV